MNLQLLPLLAGLLPLIACYAAFGIGVMAEAIPPCIPFIDGCASVSATGRKPPGSFLFRAVMLPQSVVLLFTWLFTIAWLRSLGAELSKRYRVALLTSAVVSSVALVLYVTFLGTREPFYEFMRRFGIYLYFIGMVVVQILVAVALIKMEAVQRDARLKRATQVMLVLCLSPFVLGALNFVLKATLADADASENVIEWIAATLMQFYLLVMYTMWRRTRYSVTVHSTI